MDVHAQEVDTRLGKLEESIAKLNSTIGVHTKAVSASNSRAASPDKLGPVYASKKTIKFILAQFNLTQGYHINA